MNPINAVCTAKSWRKRGKSVVLALSFVWFAGCGGHSKTATEISSLPDESGTVAPDRMRDGKLELGSHSLTHGVPGSGPLSIAELNLWLDDPRNHEPLDVVLPAHLQQPDIEIEDLIPDDNPLTRAKIELGRQLFFDKRLSGFGTFSCATCHQPRQSFGSYQVMPEIGRNVLPVLNRVLGEEQFWDGRAENLEAQPLSPIENPFEMNSSPEQSAANIQAVPGYRLQFQRVFGELNYENICKALASFERALVTEPSAWDRGELTESARRGEELFFSERLACNSCHDGRNFTDEQYYNLGTHRLNDYTDHGRKQVTDADGDDFAFKTPSLRNVAKTPPYMHNGTFGTLEQVIDFFDRGGEELESGERPLAKLSLSRAEKSDLVEFLKSLSSSLPPVETGRLPE